MATMIVVGVLVMFGALFAAMAVMPIVIEVLSSKSDETKQSSSPVSFERQLPRLASNHDAQAA